ncbi:hypothetical protein LguiB_035824 [Lonicera macranthoides]
MVSPNTLFNLKESTFAKTLYKEVTRLIGLKSLIEIELSFFGIRQMKVAFVLTLTTLLLQNSPKTFIISSFIVSHQ